jgi:XTP/dITP diphosphohydrolase
VAAQESSASGEPLLEFLEVMRRLRAECPWKREQTHRSLARYLVEELHETLEAIEVGDADHLSEELGDLLLQVYFHAVIAEENGSFTLDDVALGIIDKMRRRNPHVFGDEGGDEVHAQDAAAVNEVWQAIKSRERSERPLTEGLPQTLPALLFAAKVLERRDRAGLSVTRQKVSDGSAEVPLGERLLALVAEANEQGLDPEQALRDAVRRLPDR